MRRTTTLIALALALTACSDSGSGSSDRNGSERAVDADPIDSTELLESGFGQNPESPEYVRAIAIVGTTGDAAVGRFVEVSVNFLDGAGGLIATETQTESFTWPDQQLVLPVYASIDSGESIASIDVSYTLSDYAAGDEAEPLDTVEADEIRDDRYRGTEAVFTLTNPTEEALQDLRVGVVCRDERGAIIGGTSEYPGAVPPGGQILLEADVTTSGEPASCEAYPNHSSF